MSADTVIPTSPAAGRGRPLRLAAPSRARPPWAPRAPAVERPRLLAPLVGTDAPLVLLAAPAGYGKTTLLAGWAARERRPVTRVRAPSDGDDAPGALARAAADALDRPPAVVALDDAHLVRSPAAWAALGELVDAVPPGSTLAVLARAEPPLPLARLRADDAVVELRAGDLALTRLELAAAFAAAGIRLTAAQQGRALAATEGWPAAVRLLLRAARDRPLALERFTGDDGPLARYVRDEVLAPLAPADRAFLRRVAVLDHLTAGSCDAVAGVHGSGERLRTLAAAGALVLPCDRSEQTFRLHPLVAQALRADLRATEPAAEPELHRRASGWHAARGAMAPAIAHAAAARDLDGVGALIAAVLPERLAAGRVDDLRERLAELPDRELRARPALALAAGATALVAGDADGAGGWLDAAGAGGGPGARAVGPVPLALLRAALAPEGGEAMLADAARAHAGATGAASALRPLTWTVLGAARALHGAPDARATLARGAQAAGTRAPLARALCLALRVLDELHEPEGAAPSAAGAALVVRGDPAGPAWALPHAVAAAVAARSGSPAAARAGVLRADAVLRAAPAPVPWHAAAVELALATATLALGDARAGDERLRAAERWAAAVPRAAGLERWLAAARARRDALAAAAGPPGSVPLTLAELRVLRLLPTHLTLREIAARLQVSPNTVKTQAQAVYRKLDASCRSDAVRRALQAGLVEP